MKFHLFSPATQPGCSLSLRSRIFSSFWTAVSTSSSTASSGQGDHFFVFSSSTYKVVFKVPRPVPTSPELMLHWQSDARQQVFLKIAAWCPYMEEIKLGEDCHRISRFDTTEMSKILEDVLVLQLMLTELTWMIWITGVKRMVGWQEWQWRGWQGEWGVTWGDMGSFPAMWLSVLSVQSIKVSKGHRVCILYKL